jgi:hypothetical protein
MNDGSFAGAWHDGNWDGDYADGCDSVLYYTYDGNFNVTGLVKTDGAMIDIGDCLSFS